MSTLFLSPLFMLSLKIVTMTEKLRGPVRSEVLSLVALDGCVGLFLLLSIGVILVKQRRARSRGDKAEVIVARDSNENNLIRVVHCETDV